MSNKPTLDLATALGLCLGIGSLITSMILEFGELNPDLGSPFLKVSALLIIFGGTIGCACISFPMREIKKIPTFLRIALFNRSEDPQELVETVVKLAEVARRDGVLALDSKREELKESYPFLALGIAPVIDGVSPDRTKEILTNEIYAMEERHKVGPALFASMGGFAPTMGIIGTVVGLIGALAKAGEGGEDPTAVVEAIATAFIATFYGISSANLVFLPLGAKLHSVSAEEAFSKMVMAEAILSIQNGENPRALGEALRVFFRRGEVTPRKGA